MSYKLKILFIFCISVTYLPLKTLANNELVTNLLLFNRLELDECVKVQHSEENEFEIHSLPPH